MDLREIQWGGADRIDLTQGPMEGSCEHGNKLSCSIKHLEVLEQLHNWKPLEKGSAPWGSLVLVHESIPKHCFWLQWKLISDPLRISES
jgi:hypothetical protein